MTGCIDVPEGKAAEAIRKTEQTGKEHAFVVCGDGEVITPDDADFFVGDQDSVEIEVDTECENAVVFHTHPNDVLRPSEQDKKLLDHSHVDLMCVGDTKGRYACQRDGYACVVDTDETAAEPPAGQNTNTAPALSAPMGDDNCPFDDDRTDHLEAPSGMARALNKARYVRFSERGDLVFAWHGGTQVNVHRIGRDGEFEPATTFTPRPDDWQDARDAIEDWADRENIRLDDQV